MSPSLPSLKPSWRQLGERTGTLCEDLGISAPEGSARRMRLARLNERDVNLRRLPNQALQRTGLRPAAERQSGR
jgi:hypothetical protein